MRKRLALKTEKKMTAFLGNGGLDIYFSTWEKCHAWNFDPGYYQTHKNRGMKVTALCLYFDVARVAPLRILATNG